MVINYHIYRAFLILGMSLVPALAIYVVLMLFNIKKIKKSSIKKEVLKYIYILYILVTLRITGVTEMIYEFDNFSRITDMDIAIPFLGNSFRMIAFNFLLFVPMGFLTPVISNKEWNWRKILILGFAISGCIEGLQLVGGRLPEIDDILANALGCYGGLLVLQFVKACIQKEKYKVRKSFAELMILLVLFFVPVGIVANEDWAEYENELEYLELARSGNDLVKNYGYLCFEIKSV